MSRRRVAAFTPGPPSRHGGAVYAGALLPALAGHVDVVAVTPGEFAWDGPTTTPEEVDPADFDVLLHFVADDPDHLFAYRAALRWGGVVVGHELNLPHLLSTCGPDEELADLVEALGAEQAGEVVGRRRRGVATHEEAYLLLALNRAMRRAEAVIVHSRFAELAVRSELPETPVFRVPMPAATVPPDIPGRAEARRRLGLAPDAFLVGLMGHLGGHKRVDVALRAVAAAVPPAASHGVDLHLVVVGTDVGSDLAAAIERTGLADRTTIRPAVDDASFFAHMAALDVLVNLRYPTLGETSATTAQAMLLGTPVITTDHAQFAEDRAAIRVRPDEHEVDGVTDALVALATCGGCRSRVAQLGRQHATRHTVEHAATAYAEAIEATLARRAVAPRGGRRSARLVRGPQHPASLPGGPLGQGAGGGVAPREP